MTLSGAPLVTSSRLSPFPTTTTRSRRSKSNGTPSSLRYASHIGVIVTQNGYIEWIAHLVAAQRLVNGIAHPGLAANY